MLKYPHFEGLFPALGASFAAVVVISAVQGAILFHRELLAALGPPDCSIGRVSLVDNDRAALIRFAVVPAHENVPLKHMVGICGLSSEPPSFEIVCPDLTPHRVVAASLGSWMYIATHRGEIYGLDLQVQPWRPIHLGRHDHSHVAVLECSEDGSIIIAAAQNTLIAWDRGTKHALWRRDGLRVFCCAFVPGAARVVCGLDSGEVLELDAHTGATLRKLAEHDRWVNEVAISPRSDYVATVDLDNRLMVIDVARGRQVWSRVLRKFVRGIPSEAPVRPVFSASGDILALVDSVGGEKVLFVRPADGLVLNSRAHTGFSIKGLAMAKNGTCYWWDYGGTVTEWRPGAEAAIRRFWPAQNWIDCSSESTFYSRS